MFLFATPLRLSCVVMLSSSLPADLSCSSHKIALTVNHVAFRPFQLTQILTISSDGSISAAFLLTPELHLPRSNVCTATALLHDAGALSICKQKQAYLPDILELRLFQPPHPSERLEMYQQAPNNTQCSFPPPSHLNGPSAPFHNPEALIADMWKTCPALCASIRHNFDLDSVFHPDIIAHYGETFLRLAASQIAMQNQATQMRDMRRALTQKQRLLDVNAASAKGLQTKLLEQQSELEEIRSLLEQQSQSLTTSDASNSGEQPRSPESGAASQGDNFSSTKQASTLKALDLPVYLFYGRSAALPSLRASLPLDSVEKYDERYGYGHAETEGPAFQLGCAEDHTSDRQILHHWCQPDSVPPAVSTCTIFEPDPSAAKPIVSIFGNERRSIAHHNEEDTERADSMPSKYQTPTIDDTTAITGIRIMKREDGHDPAARALENTVETSNIKVPNGICYTNPTDSPPKSISGMATSQSPTTVAAKKPASYAAAVRTTPSRFPRDDDLGATRPTTTSNSTPALDLGFTLEPLPKPTVQQVQCQQQQPSTSSPNDNREDISFDFEAWKQQKIAAGTWVDRSQPSNISRPQQRPLRQPNRVRGGRSYHHNSILRSGSVGEEARKQDWLAWKQNLASQGKWNPKYPFREAWKND